MRTSGTKAAVAAEVAGLDAYGWHAIDCVKCGRTRKMRVCLDEGDPLYSYFQCWSPDCGVKGFYDKNADDVDEREERERELVVEALPDRYEPLTTESGNHRARKFHEYRQYLYGRGVSQYIIDKVGLGCIHSGRFAYYVVIPYRKDGEIIGWAARSIYGKRFHYPEDWPKTQWPLNGDAVVRKSKKPVIIVEGQYDALPLYPFGVAVGGQPSAQDWKLLQTAKRPVVLGFDADVGTVSQFGAAYLQLSALRMGRHAKVAWLKLPPGRDPGDVGREKVLKKAFALVGLGGR